MSLVRRCRWIQSAKGVPALLVAVPRYASRARPPLTESTSAIPAVNISLLMLMVPILLLMPPLLIPALLQPTIRL